MPAYTDPGSVEFDALITRNTEVSNSSAWIEFPYDVPELYGVRGRVPVQATFDDIPYRGSLVKMGSGNHLLIVVKEIQAQLAKSPGATVHVTVALDTEERVIELGADVAAALQQHPDALAVWQRLSYSHQREYFLWIEGAKRPETRQRRIGTMCEKLCSDTPTMT